MELGKYSKSIHKKVGKVLKKQDAMIILVGNEVKYSYNKNFIIKDNYKEVISFLENINLHNKVIYLKGSRKMELEEIKNYLEQKMTD